MDDVLLAVVAKPCIIWPVGQAVKTSPFHGGNPGSIPGRVTRKPADAKASAGFPFVPEQESENISISCSFLSDKASKEMAQEKSVPFLLFVAQLYQKYRNDIIEP